MTSMTPEQVREIAENAASTAATKAVHDTLTALGFDMNNLHRGQQVWAFTRTFHDGTRRGICAMFTASSGRSLRPSLDGYGLRSATGTHEACRFFSAARSRSIANRDAFFSASFFSIIRRNARVDASSFRVIFTEAAFGLVSLRPRQLTRR